MGIGVSYTCYIPLSCGLAQYGSFPSIAPACAPANDTGTIAATGTTRCILRTLYTTLLNPICAKRFHSHHGGQQALLSRPYRDHLLIAGINGITTYRIVYERVSILVLDVVIEGLLHLVHADRRQIIP